MHPQPRPRFGGAFLRPLLLRPLAPHEVVEARITDTSLEAVEFATLEWVDWFNNRRLLEPIGNIPPAEAEERYYAACHGGVTQTKWPPTNPGRFDLHGSLPPVLRPPGA